jgi:hypothetical protein
VAITKNELSALDRRELQQLAMSMDITKNELSALDPEYLSRRGLTTPIPFKDNLKSMDIINALLEFYQMEANAGRAIALPHAQSPAAPAAAEAVIGAAEKDLYALSDRVSGLLGVALVLWTALLSWWGLPMMDGELAWWSPHYFIPIVSFGALHAFPEYLSKQSPLVGHADVVGISAEDRSRKWTHPLVWSSFCYGGASLYALWSGLFSVATLLLVVCWGSVMFHKFKETMWFNLDNIYAQSLIGVGVFGDVYYIVQLALSGTTEDMVKLCAIIVLALATLYVLLASGQPAFVSCCCDGKRHREENPAYSPLHTAWHFGSAILVCIAIWVISWTKGASASWFFLGYWDQFDDAEGVPIPVASTTALAIGLFVNFILNYTDTAPWK